jgi:hypothetical protein
MQIGDHDDRIQAPAGATKPCISRQAERNVSDTTEHLELPQRVRVRAPGLRVELVTVERSIRFRQKRTTGTSYSPAMDVRAGLASRGAENAKGQRLAGRGPPTHAGTFE